MSANTLNWILGGLSILWMVAYFINAYLGKGQYYERACKSLVHNMKQVSGVLDYVLKHPLVGEPQLITSKEGSFNVYSFTESQVEQLRVLAIMLDASEVDPDPKQAAQVRERVDNLAVQIISSMEHENRIIESLNTEQESTDETVGN